MNKKEIFEYIKEFCEQITVENDKDVTSGRYIVRFEVYISPENDSKMLEFELNKGEWHLNKERKMEKNSYYEYDNNLPLLDLPGWADSWHPREAPDPFDYLLFEYEKAKKRFESEYDVRNDYELKGLGSKSILCNIYDLQAFLYFFELIHGCYKPDEKIILIDLKKFKKEELLALLFDMRDLYSIVRQKIRNLQEGRAIQIQNSMDYDRWK